MNLDLSIIILAAGFGTRMKSKTPKVLHSMSGYPMLYHIIKEAKKISTDIHVVLYHEYKMVKESMEEYFQDISYHVQDHANYPGTGGALKGLHVRSEKVFILSGDMPLVTSATLKTFLDFDDDVVMSAFSPKNIRGYGRVLMDEQMNVKRIVEEKDASLEEKRVNTANAGVYVIKRDFLTRMLPKLSSDNAQKEYYITDFVELANKNNYSVKAVLVDEEEFMGVNSKAHLAHAESIMQKRVKDALMEEGVIMQLPETIYIDARATLTGECVIENGVRIEGECHIKNTHIKAHSVVEDSVIENSSVGPLAHIRPKCFIQNSHIGNFVEIKKSNLQGVKAGHLSYLGDASIDEGTNVGCGTITCNYDGVKKHKTIIGKNVFIGSDTQFVAPVIVEDNVLIAAGTTVAKNLKEGVLAIDRTPLKQVEGFYKRFFDKAKEDAKK